MREIYAATSVLTDALRSQGLDRGLILMDTSAHRSREIA
jgi:hypothetical protein